MVENCGNCAFGIKFGSVHGELHCHRRAPAVFYGVVSRSYSAVCNGESSVKEHMGEITAWPTVRNIDFCGEWELTDARS